MPAGLLAQNAQYDGAVFSYRHSFHAGNHADVLKHVCLVAILRHLMRKPGPLLLVDTHAGAGSYRLDAGWAVKSGEAQSGVQQLRSWLRGHAGSGANSGAVIESALRDYLALLQAFNPGPGDAWPVYPGSPALMHALMNAPARVDVADRLHLFEWHPTVQRLLAEQVAAWPDARRVAVHAADGFAGLKSRLPPPPAAVGPRRGFVLIDPPYELKTDYESVTRAVADALARFATGVYMIWYPIVAQPGARRLPQRLKEQAGRAGRDWLHATLDVGAPIVGAQRGLAASGVLVINPPYTLTRTLRASLPLMAQALSRGTGERWQVESAVC